MLQIRLRGGYPSSSQDTLISMSSSERFSNATAMLPSERDFFQICKATADQSLGEKLRHFNRSDLGLILTWFVLQLRMRQATGLPCLPSGS